MTEHDTAKHIAAEHHRTSHGVPVTNPHDGHPHVPERETTHEHDDSPHHHHETEHEHQR